MNKTKKLHLVDTFFKVASIFFLIFSKERLQNDKKQTKNDKKVAKMQKSSMHVFKRYACKCALAHAQILLINSGDQS